VLAEAVALRLGRKPEGIAHEANRDGYPLALKDCGHKLVAIEIDVLNANRTLWEFRKVSHASSNYMWRNATLAQMIRGVKR
jgi:hypothetical protein